MTIDDLKILAELRLKEAKELSNQGLYDGACYLAGYAIELALKATICKLLGTDFPPAASSRTDINKAYQTHNLLDLISLAGLKTDFIRRQANPAFNTHWGRISNWSEAWRYLPKDTKNRQDAVDFVNALEDPSDGIFTWIKSTWQ